MISGEGITVDPERICTIQEWAPPKNVKQLRSFLGLASYCRKFVVNFSKIAKPMTDLLCKDKRYSWLIGVEGGRSVRDHYEGGA